MVRGKNFPLRGLFPEELANDDGVVVPNRLFATRSYQDPRDPIEGFLIGYRCGKVMDFCRLRGAISLEVRGYEILGSAGACSQHIPDL